LVACLLFLNAATLACALDHIGRPARNAGDEPDGWLVAIKGALQR
jgi:hypothetical protein